MWVIALLGCASKFSEIVLGIKYREKDASGEYVGGPTYYLAKGFKNKALGKFLAGWFAFFLMIEIIPVHLYSDRFRCAECSHPGYS